MSSYTTKTISRAEAEKMVRLARQKYKLVEIENMSDDHLGNELHKYVYSEKYTDIVGVLYNYIIE